MEVSSTSSQFNHADISGFGLWDWCFCLFFLGARGYREGILEDTGRFFLFSWKGD